MSAVAEITRNVPAHVPPELVFEFDIYKDSRVTDDVQGSYSEALKGAPDIFYTPANGGHWMVRRYEAIADIVKDYEHFSVREMQIPRVPDPPFFIPLSLDPPTNLPIDLIEEVVAKGECDFIRDISSRFPVSVFMQLMGMPLDRLREFRALADEYFEARTPEDIGRLSGRIIGLMTDLIELRRRDPGPDLVSHMLTVQIDGRPILLEEMQAMFFVLFLGGMDTVTNVTGFTFQHFGATPELQERLAADPSLIPKFVEEGLRCFGVINTPRLVVRDVDRFGVPFRSGDMVLCLLPMAGRDDRLSDDPDRFDLDRARSQHLTFSTGPHLCIGHILAKSEIRILTEEWVKRIPRFSVKPGVRHGFRIGTVQAIDSLPLEWTVAAE
jgi:cytochrome P450